MYLCSEKTNIPVKIQSSVCFEEEWVHSCWGRSIAEQCTVCIVSNNPVLGVTVNIVLQIKLFREKYSTECFIVLVWGLEVKWEFIVHILSVLTRPGLPWSHPVRERREYCNICSALATPDPRYGPANLYVGPRSPGNLHPSIHIISKF